MRLTDHAQLRAFHAVATEGSFIKTARVLRVSQPALKIQFKALDEAGVRPRVAMEIGSRESLREAVAAWVPSPTRPAGFGGDAPGLLVDARFRSRCTPLAATCHRQARNEKYH